MADEITGEAAPPTETPKTVVTPAPTEKAAAEPMVSITVSQYQAQIARDREYAEFKAAQAVELEKREQAKIKALAEKGDIEKALEETKKSAFARQQEAEGKLAALLQSLADKERDAAIRKGVSGRQFVGGDEATRAKAAATFEKLAREKLAASQDGQGGWLVKDPNTGRSADDVLAELAAEHSFLFAATTQGGSGSTGGNGINRPAPAASTLEAFGLAFQQDQAKHRSFGLDRVN